METKDEEKWTNNQDEQLAVEYLSGELLLSTIQKEYDYENIRKSTLETRSGVLLTLTAAVSTFAVTNIKIPSGILSFSSNTQLYSYLSIYFFLGIIAIAVILALIFLLKVLLIDEYRRLDLAGFNEDNARFSNNIVAMALTEEYRNIITHNHEKNNQKVKYYRNGIYSAIVAVISIIILYGVSKYGKGW